jgi:hypothetical protein
MLKTVPSLLPVEAGDSAMPCILVVLVAHFDTMGDGHMYISKGTTGDAGV